MKRISLIIISCFVLQFSAAQYDGYSSSSWENQLKIEDLFLKHIDKTSFKKHLQKLTERPHVVGSKTNEEVIRYIGEVMNEAGLDVINYPYDVYLPKHPGSSLIEIVTPSRPVSYTHLTLPTILLV